YLIQFTVTPWYHPRFQATLTPVKKKQALDREGGRGTGSSLKEGGIYRIERPRNPPAVNENPWQ
ncbi:MAG: hypothetical protein ACE5ER_11265, partial [Nitrospinaceae bacterium]